MKTFSRPACLLLLFGSFSMALTQDEFATIPASSKKLTDSVTGIEVETQISEFRIARTETMQSEFSRIMGCNPSFHQGPDLPVENVSWWEAIRYCNLRSLKEGLEPCYDLATGERDPSRAGYRLPTEAEWLKAFGDSVQFTAETIGQYGNIGSANTKSLEELKKDLAGRMPQKAGSRPANKNGLFDMLGNVWEWCDDYNGRVAGHPVPLIDPRGPVWAPERVLLGGSFISLAGNWGRSYRSSIKPEYKSRFTGFRLCLSTGRRWSAAAPEESVWAEPYNRVPADFENRTGELSSLVQDSQGKAIATLEGWEKRRAGIKAKWEKILGLSAETSGKPNVKEVRTFEEELYTGKLMYLQVEPEFWEKIYLMYPRSPLRSPAPVVIVPYYDVDVPAGQPLGGRTYLPPGTRSFAYLMVQQGYIACAIRWFGESYGEGYGEAVANLKLNHPGLSGLGKWVRDSRCLLDYLYTLPGVDRDNIGIIGHSLGAKMSLYAAANEPRITAVVCSEPGMGLDFSNYEDYWYHDNSILARDKATDHHELLGLIAPRPFLLIGGDSADNDNSWYYINSARPVYQLFGKPLNIGYFNHRSGHSPTPEAVGLAVDWLKHFLGGN